jgi:hypothetical protein
MTKLRRFTPIASLFSGALVLVATSRAATRAPIAEQLAKKYGLESFGQVEAIRYTFHAKFPGVDLSRSWVWEPKTDQVSFEGTDKDGKPVKATYARSQLSSQPPNVRNEIDPAFVNDNYWLLFPLHVSWDYGADVEDLGRQKLPQGSGSATRVAVKYPSPREGGGYTPGDTWELWVGSDHRVEEFIYHRGGPMKPSVVIATWAGYKKAGPLLISTDHRGTADGQPLQISFSNVSVKLVGSDKWVEAR